MTARHVLFASFLCLAVTHCSSDPPEENGNESIVENHPHQLVITSPSRAAFIEQSKQQSDLIEVRGTGATTALTVNGAPADVGADGAFHATIHATQGLNLIVAVDGDARLETPFMYGRFVSAETPVAAGIALDIGAMGVAAPLPAASIESVANLALADRDLVGSFKGQAFNGTVSGATWTFTVTNGKNGPTKLSLSNVARGLGVNATASNVSIDGRLTLTALGLTYARDVRITVDSANVTGDVEVGLDPAKGALTAAMPNAEAKLDGFRFDTDNAGFPCCVDSIITGFMKPKVEEAIRDGIRNEVPKLVSLTLDGIGVPKQVDFAVGGVAVKFPIATRFDSAEFDTFGGVITASTLFGGKAAPNTPQARTPGWLTLAPPYAPAPTHAPVLGVSFSIDALNQLMFAAWGSGSLSFTAPAPLSAKLAPALPPLVSVTEDGALRVALGEILVQRTSSAQPLAAVTVIQDVKAAAEADALILIPEGQPTISITWLTDEIEGSGRNLVAVAAKDQLGKLLKPFRVPVPKFELGALGPAFTGQSLAIQSPHVTLDKRTGRLTAAGSLALSK